MKKLLALFVVFALLLPVLAGCQSVFATQHKETTASISQDQAVEIALQNAGLTRQEIYDLDVEPDKDRGALHYDVDFEKDGRDYEYEIDAATGAILKKEVPTLDPIVTPQPAPTVPQTPTVTPEMVPQNTVGPMLREEAVAIALAHAGLTKEQVRDLDAERDDKRGIPCYEVDFEAAGWDYEYEIHAVTGEILCTEKEPD